MTGEKKSNTLLIVLMVVGGVLLFGVVVVGILAALGISGFRSYLSAAKGAEGQNGAMVLARGVAECTQQKQASSGSLTLPASAPPVPSSLSQVSGRKYQSSPSDWSADAYTCANFSMTMPQYFQYEWQLDTPTSGRAIARGDIDGDGKPDQQFSVTVTCAGSVCTAAAPSRP